METPWLFSPLETFAIITGIRRTTRGMGKQTIVNPAAPPGGGDRVRLDYFRDGKRQIDQRRRAARVRRGVFGSRPGGDRKQGSSIADSYRRTPDLLDFHAVPFFFLLFCRFAIIIAVAITMA